MANAFASCYVLHTQPFKETSLLVRLFSKEFGRFSVIAKGIKRKNAQALRAILQPFMLLKIEFVGRSELKTLRQAELLSDFKKLPPASLACGYYLNELLLRSTQEGQDFSQLFACYKSSIAALKERDDYRTVLRNFEADLLEALGVAPSWILDIQSNQIESDERYSFVDDKGFEKQTINELSHETNDQFNSFSGESIISFHHRVYPSHSCRESQKISQMLLRKIIGDKPLESRKLWLKSY